MNTNTTSDRPTAASTIVGPTFWGPEHHRDDDWAQRTFDFRAADRPDDN